MLVTRAILLAALALVGAAPAVGASASDVRDCVIRNLVKYSDPDRAAVAQYVDIEAACRAALDDRASGGIVIAGGDGGSDDPGGDPGTSAGRPDAADGGTASQDPGSQPASPPGADADRGSPSPAPERRTGEAAGSSPVLAASLESSSASPSLGASAPPAWIVVLVVVLIAALAAPRLVGVLRRRR